MNKEYIEELLKDEEMVHKISKLRMQFNHFMTEFFFFRTFFEALSQINISGSIDKQSVMLENGVKTDCFIILTENGDSLKSKYDQNELQKKLSEYNEKQGGTGLILSAYALIDIFVNLL